MTTDTYRLFFALVPPETVQRRILQIAELETRALSCKPVNPACYHLTLAFLGTQASEALETIINVAGRLQPPKGTLVLDRIGYYSNAQALWLGSCFEPPGLCVFTEKLHHELDSLGVAIPKVRTHWEAHVTIARKVSLAKACKRKIVNSIEWSYCSWHLMKSTLDHSGAKYCSMAMWPKDSPVK